MPTSKNITELGEKPVGRLLLSYAVPAIVAMTASSLYNIVDGIFVGQGVGQEAIMGLALTNPVMALSAAFGAMVGVGGSTLLSVRLGQKDYTSARKILGNVVLLNMGVGIVLAVVMLSVLDPTLRFFGASDHTLPYARSFMQVILAGNLVTHLYLGLNAMLRSMGKPRQAMYATFGTVGLNCLLAPLFIFVLHLGIRGAALATILSQLAMLCWQLRLFTDRREFLHLERSQLRADRHIMHETLVIGLPQFLVNVCACLVAIIITRSMAAFGGAERGDISVGAYGIGNRLIMFMVFVVFGLNQGMQPIAGFNYGAGHLQRLMRVLRLTLLSATCITCTGFALAMLWAEPCAALFAKDAPELVGEAARGLRIMSIMFPLVGAQIVTTAFFQSVGMPGKSIFLSLTRQLLFLVPALLLLPHLLSDHVLGVWVAMPVSDALAAITSLSMLVWQTRRMMHH